MNKAIANLETRTYFPALTGLRAIAAYIVFAFHYNPFPVVSDVNWLPLAHRLVNELHIGVTIFFVLSGFLVCYQYYDSVAQRPMNWVFNYFICRFAKIYPLYFLLTICTFLFFLAAPIRYEQTYDGLRHVVGKNQLNIFLLNITLLKGLFNQYKLSGIAQSWSLTVEGCFYIGAPLFILMFQRNKYALVLLSLYGLTTLILLEFTVGRLDWHGLFSNFIFNLNYTFFGRCIEFFAGMTLAMSLLKQKYSYKERRNNYFTALSILLMLTCLLIMASISGKDNSKDKLSGIFINNIVIAFAVCLLLYGLIKEKTWLYTILSSRIFILLGRSSYAFYLIHLGVFSILLRTYLTTNPVVIFAIMNLLAIVFYKLIELPIYQLIKRLAVKRS